MVIASHVIFCAYGFWLPNDPRGSWSDVVAAWELLRFGRATTTDTRRSVAGAQHDIQQRRLAKRALKYPHVSFTGTQALTISRGFAKAITESDYRVHACAILPEHVHMVIARHADRTVERIVGHLKGRATQALVDADWPKGRPVWAERCWKVFLDDDRDVHRAIDYVNQNPIKERKPPQTWSFIHR
ncbi:hypothetical protein HED60_06590 [Planctomycetales bacterium ZRK34]|nr:hypothetical protein HED60_06590 [Planctomycetales bacterium ZRK34]